ncbi:MAG: hypothetical protein ACW98D_11245 [Promethearchaeota archaeon]|jgi:hypothetical protein
MKNINENVKIFGFNLEFPWRGTLYLFSLIGMIFGSSFWTEIGGFVYFVYAISLRVFPEILTTYYVGIAITTIFKFFLLLMIFSFCFFLLQKCRYSSRINPEMKSEIRLFNFNLSRTHLLGILSLSLILILYIVHLVILNINQLVYQISILPYSSPMSGVPQFFFIFQSIVYPYLIVTEITIIGICSFSLHKCRTALKRAE